ncbi:YdbL family protein [Pokkaliibacter sp. CJK22405]|uniref:YdbL family protein n=1 Tax=Pokkaliibacter sp. CJK22405 TaxID=3384615 RepID=UPI003984D754
MKRFSLLVSVLAGLMFSAMVWALDIDSAKSQGLVGESNRGYLVAMVKGNNAVDSLVNDINEKRRQVYQRNASAAGVTLDVMEVRIGQRLYDKASGGEYVQNANGQWIKK